MSKKMAEQFRLTRRNGVLWRVEALDRDSNVLCEIPLTGIETREGVTGGSEVRLLVHPSRVDFEDYRG